MSRVEPERNRYVGHRYVPKIFGEWDKQNDYEGLSIVTHQGASYTSKKRVPVGIDILNDEFWVVTGNYDAQVEYYRQETERVAKDLLLKSDKTYVDTELGKKSDKTYVDTELGKKANQTYVDTELGKKANQTYVDTELNERFINIKSLGAENNTDVTTILKQAIEMATLSSKGVYVPKGNFNITEMNVLDNVELYGSGSLHLIGNSDQPVKIKNNVIINGINFIGNKSTQDINQIFMKIEGTHVKIINCMFKDFYDKIIYFDRRSDYGTVSRCTFTDNGIVGNCNAISISSSFTKVQDSIFLNHGNGHSIRTGYFDGDKPFDVTNIIINNNFMSELDHNAITLENGSKYISVLNNHIENAPQAIKAEKTINNVEFITVKNNYMKNISLDTGFNLLTTDNCIVEGNTLINSGGGLSVGDNGLLNNNKVINCINGLTARHNTITTNNIIQNCTGRPVNAYSGLISGNEIIDCKPTTNRILMYAGETPDSEGISIIGNVFINPIEHVGSSNSCISFSGKNIVCSNNVLTDDSHNMTYGVYIRSGAEGYIVKDNIMNTKNKIVYGETVDDKNIVKDNVEIRPV